MEDAADGTASWFESQSLVGNLGCLKDLSMQDRKGKKEANDSFRCILDGDGCAWEDGRGSQRKGVDVGVDPACRRDDAPEEDMHAS